MKTKQFLKGATLAAIMLAATAPFYSCSQDDSSLPGEGSRVAVDFSSQTRTGPGIAGGTQWVAGDQVGIFMLTKDGTLPTDITQDADNIPHHVDATTGALTPVDANQTIFYPHTGRVDFIAYYPYRATPVADPYTYKVDIRLQSTATAQAAVDVLYAQATDVSRSSTAVPLAFDHALSKIVINVQSGAGMSGANFAMMGVSFTGFPTTADLSLANGTSFSNPDNITAFSPLRWDAASDAAFAATCEAILIPQANGTGRKVEFTVDFNVYTWTLPGDAAFEQGKTHTYTITINKTGITVASGDPAITAWTVPGGLATPAGMRQIDVVKIKAGTFMMGSPEGEPDRWDDEVQHQVTLSMDFYMSKYAITNAQYAAFLNAKGIGGDGKGSISYMIDGSLTTTNEPFISAHNTWGVWRNGTIWQPAVGKDQFPVINVTWYGAKAFADWVGGALPTEAQWEYACRAGTTTAYSFGADATDIANYAWYPTNSGSTTHPVGGKLPNPWGLYDMHGNVWEWCSDWYGTYAGDAIDPTGPDRGSRRVLRGGSWGDGAQGCRSASRYDYYPDNASDRFGFRVVFVP